MAKLSNGQRRDLERKLPEYARRGDKDKITYAKAMLGEARVRAILGDLYVGPKQQTVKYVEPNQQTMKYVGHKEFEKDQKNWLRKGYHIASINEIKQPAGVRRIATIGLGALVVKPKSHFYVTYEKD